MKKLWLWLASAAAILMGLASAAGIWLPFVYAKETASWAAQGTGQDVVNLLVVLPAMLAAVSGAGRDSVRAVLVCAGLLLYIVYSYVLYAFFVHFNALFPIYIAVLGTSFYALLGLLIAVDRDQVREAFADRSGRAQSVYLMASGVLFGALWTSSITSGLVSGGTPRELIETGLPVNPVHVLDLAFVLPGMILTSVLLWRRHPLGLLLAVPLLVFATAMGSAILGMFVVMRARGLSAPAPAIAIMAVMTTLSLGLAMDFALPKIRHPRAIRG